ncbi:integrin alpha-9-like [Linepithema humile]|uniref:integrin alpha-9-like n=1 Tax=Linepithema humile TaxID=83485 RepID=UPI00351E7992
MISLWCSDTTSDGRKKRKKVSSVTNASRITIPDCAKVRVKSLKAPCRMIRAHESLAMCFHLRILILALTIMRHDASAYNINSFNAKVFGVQASHGRRSYFGFSVALYANANESLLLVGAPRANSSELPSVREPGTVFKCTMNDTCEMWTVDDVGNGRHPQLKFDQIKNDSWIGATIAVENKTEARIVVCAPRWINYKERDFHMNGICYATLATNSSAFERNAEELLSPLSNGNENEFFKKKRFYNYAMGQAGFSLRMDSLKNKVNVAMGSPGVCNWNGDAILTTAEKNGRFSGTKIPAVAEEKKLYDDNYFGYAITAGAYFNEKNVLYASSAPRSKMLYGKVLVLDFPSKHNKPIVIKTIVEGEQLGEYFGAVLTSCDINNDRKHELIVGAPQWSKDTDEGRVYIFTSRRKDKFEKPQTIDGAIVGGRFGAAVMCLSDIDYDGYGDIAVGAPYEEDGGAVYIFNGNEHGRFRKYSQKLMGTRFSPTIRGFGISISEPRDINRDNYSDIAVGAYLSDEVVLLQSVPVVTLNATLTYLQKVKLLRNATSFTIDLHMSYEGAYVPEELPIIAILKIDQMHGRATYQAQKSNDGPQTYRLHYTLQKATLTHKALEINLTENIQNIIDPLEISVLMQVENDLHANNRISSPCTFCVVINKQYSQIENSTILPFAVECGEDEVCVCDLGVRLSTDATPDNRYVIGAASMITLQIDADNRGEPAYQAKVLISTEILTLANIPPECVESSAATGSLEIICNIGNPLRTNKTLTLQLDMSGVRHDVREVELRANISTKSHEKNWEDNNYVITVYFDLDIDIAITGKTQGNWYSYLREGKETPPDSVRFQHFYKVQNFGASAVEEAVLTVKIPTHIRLPGIGEIAIVNIGDLEMNGQELFCGYSSQTEVSTSVVEEITENTIAVNSSSANGTKFSIEGAPMNALSENRTFYINCTNNAIRCEQIDCRLGPFLSSLHVAKFLVTLDLQVKNFPNDVIKNNDVILYATEGSVAVTQPGNFTEGNKPNTTLVTTKFLTSPIAQRISVLIIVLSAILGVLLLLLMILGLVKVGFFNRKKKLELEALKAETDKTYWILKTTSAMEPFDQDCD